MVSVVLVRYFFVFFSLCTYKRTYDFKIQMSLKSHMSAHTSLRAYMSPNASFGAETEHKRAQIGVHIRVQEQYSGGNNFVHEKAVVGAVQ